MVARKSVGLNWAIAIILSLISLLFTLITLLSGVGGHTTASYLTIDTTNINIPAKLGSSVFLQDLSTISGSDLVGQVGTRQTLGLPATYSVSLLTACGSNDDASTTCDTPRVGFTLNPGSDLKLDGSATQGTLSSAYYNELHTYAAVSTFTAVAYILSSILTILSCLTIVLSRHFERAILIGRVSSGIATLLVLTATIASIVTFIKVRDAFNSAFGDVGVKTTVNSRAFALSAAATVVSIGAFVLVLFIRPAGSGYRGSYRQEKGVVGGAAGVDEAGLMSREPRAAGVGPGFLGRMPTWNRTRYTQLDGKKSNIRSREPSPESDREGLIDPTRDDFPHDSLNRTNGYPLSAWTNKGSRRNLEQVPTAYEPNV
ncbi:SUR7/PalI family-domain-containing protein [Nemania abortiva]|nr:SUR7/PalI family-domain-containing protein [Nemania abortiva]